MQAELLAGEKWSGQRCFCMLHLPRPADIQCG